MHKGEWEINCTRSLVYYHQQMEITFFATISCYLEIEHSRSYFGQNVLSTDELI